MKTISCILKLMQNCPLFSIIMDDPAVFNPLNYLGRRWDLEGMSMCEDVCLKCVCTATLAPVFHNPRAHRPTPVFHGLYGYSGQQRSRLTLRDSMYSLLVTDCAGALTQWGFLWPSRVCIILTRLWVWPQPGVKEHVIIALQPDMNFSQHGRAMNCSWVCLFFLKGKSRKKSPDTGNTVQIVPAIWNGWDFFSSGF